VKLARGFGVLLAGVAALLVGAMPAAASPAKGGNSPSSVFCDVNPGLPYKTGGSVAVDSTISCHDEANRPVVVDEMLGQVALYRDGVSLEKVENFDVFWISSYTRTISTPCVNGTWEGAVNIYVYYQGHLVTSGVWEGSWFGLTTTVTC
jgi:hypothetical protein